MPVVVLSISYDHCSWCMLGLFSSLLCRRIHEECLASHPMIKAQFMQKIDVCRNVQFLHGCLDVSYRSWDKSKNSYPYGNHKIPNSVHHQNLESTQPADSCFPVPDNAPQLGYARFHLRHGFLLYFHNSQANTRQYESLSTSPCITQPLANRMAGVAQCIMFFYQMMSKTEIEILVKTMLIIFN